VEIKWNEVTYGDALEMLPKMESNSIDLGFIDPPFNIDLENNVNGGKIFGDGKKTSTSYYNDVMDQAQYEGFCTKWLAEMRRICKKVLVYCGGINLPIFYRICEPIEQIIYFMKFNTIITSTSWVSRYRPVLVYTEDKNTFLGRPKGKNCKFDSNVIVKSRKFFDVTEERDRGILIHPCPIDRELMHKILVQMKPESFLDPFCGSGTTLYVAKQLGIDFIGFEKNLEYKHDHDYLLQKTRAMRHVQQKAI
jgi:modification methylase